MNQNADVQRSITCIIGCTNYSLMLSVYCSEFQLWSIWDTIPHLP
jgi:hypothetical protein